MVRRGGIFLIILVILISLFSGFVIADYMSDLSADCLKSSGSESNACKAYDSLIARQSASNSGGQAVLDQATSDYSSVSVTNFNRYDSDPMIRINYADGSYDDMRLTSFLNDYSSWGWSNSDARNVLKTNINEGHLPDTTLKSVVYTLELSTKVSDGVTENLFENKESIWDESLSFNFDPNGQTRPADGFYQGEPSTESIYGCIA